MKLDPTVVHAAALACALIIALAALLAGDKTIAAMALTGFFAVLKIPSRAGSAS